MNQLIIVNLVMIYCYSDTRLPEKIGGQELKAKDLEVKRTDKWVKMYKAWPKYKNSDKFIKRTHKGIPNKVRGLFWTLMLDLENIKKEQEGKYMVSWPSTCVYSSLISDFNVPMQS